MALDRRNARAVVTRNGSSMSSIQQQAEYLMHDLSIIERQMQATQGIVSGFHVATRHSMMEFAQTADVAQMLREHYGARWSQEYQQVLDDYVMATADAGFSFLQELAQHYQQDMNRMQSTYRYPVQQSPQPSLLSEFIDGATFGLIKPKN